MKTIKDGDYEPSQVRRYLLQIVAKSTPFIQNLQKRRSKPLDMYMKMASNVGESVAYVILMSIIFWGYDERLGFALLSLLLVGTTFANMVKNLLALPRPPSSALWCPKRLHDFGCPSSHSMNAVSIPFFCLWYVWNDVPYPYLFFGFTVLYSSSTCISRMYLACHSYLDVSIGVLIGWSMVLLWVLEFDEFEHFVVSSDTQVLVTLMVVLSLVFFILHPRSSVPSPSYNYAIGFHTLNVLT
eukprot:TRINITY_DN1534_c0_g1_i2.p1 TRINITY_DN1534_c0_g1~~TRINITY_DN1534_c0_g1_i2.p1  ORF type:complete len:264 (+),score=21.64 TRINITY_DN1534_c0_g1_i2:70-792(+)